MKKLFRRLQPRLYSCSHLSLRRQMVRRRHLRGRLYIHQSLRRQLLVKVIQKECFQLRRLLHSNRLHQHLQLVR